MWENRWHWVKDFGEDMCVSPGKYKIIARVSMREAPTLYSFELGAYRGKDGAFVPFLDHDVDFTFLFHVADEARVYVETKNKEAAELARQEHAARVQRENEARERRERKKSRHQQNLSRRREEDRNRTQRAKSGNR